MENQIQPEIRKQQTSDNRGIVLVFLFMICLVLGFTSYRFLNKTQQLTQELSRLSNQPAQAVVPEVTATPEEMTQHYEDKTVTFLYPENLFAVAHTSKSGLVQEIEFYLDEWHALETQKCIKADRGTFENPCGFGWLVFFMEVYPDPHHEKSGVKNLFNLPDGADGWQFKDIQERTWTAHADVPWTGSKMGISSHSYVVRLPEKDVVVRIAKPYYQDDRITVDFEEQLLSSLNFK